MKANLTQARIISELVNDIFIKDNVDIIHPPIPIEKVAKGLGYGIEYVKTSPYSKAADGLLSLKTKTIFVNKSNSNRERVRYTIAHEIAHIIVNEMSNEKSRFLFYGNKEIKEERLGERVADLIAAELLMPQDLMKLEAKTYSVLDKKAVENLSSLFDVSLTAMVLRIENLCNLGLLKWQVDWRSLDKLKYELLEHARDKKRKRRQRELVSSPQLTLGLNKNMDEIIRLLVDKELTKLNVLGPGLSGRTIDGYSYHSPREILNRPFVIEFSGSPCAGKNRQIKIMDEYLTDVRGFNVKVLGEAYSACPKGIKNFFDRFEWAMSETISNIIEIKDQQAQFDIILINRGLFDLLAFLHFYRENSFINKSEEKVRANYILNKRYVDLIDVVLLLTVKPETSIARKKNDTGRAVANIIDHFERKGVTSPPNNLVNKAGLELLNTCYDYVVNMYGDQFQKIYSIDCGDGVSVEECSLDIMEYIYPELDNGSYATKDFSLQKATMQRAEKAYVGGK